MTSIGPNYPSSWRKPASAQPRPETSSEVSNAQANNAPTNQNPEKAASLLSGQESAHPIFTLASEAARLTPDQLLTLLKNLLKMPREIVQLLAFFAETDGALGLELLQKLLTEDAQVPLEELQQFLQSNMNQAQGKLLKLLQSSTSGPSGLGGQTGELLNHLSELVAKTGKSPLEALHTAISLYLPYYPLHPPQAFTLRLEQSRQDDGSSETSGSDDTQWLTLFIETMALGVFKIALYTPEKIQCHVRIEHDNQSIPFQKQIAEGLQAETSAYPNQTQIVLEFITRPGPERALLSGENDLQSLPEVVQNISSTQAEKTRGQSVGLHPTGGLSVILIHAAYLLIRVILEIDNQLQGCLPAQGPSTRTSGT